MLESLIIAGSLVVWGGHAVAPWRLAGAAPERRRLWAMAALPLAATGALAALLQARAQPDAAVAAGLAPLLSSTVGRLLAIALPALVAADLVVALGWRQLEGVGWRIVGGFGVAWLLVFSLAAELLRAGEGPTGSTAALFGAAGCRAMAALAAGELAAPPGRRPWLALAAGVTLPLYPLLVPAALEQALWSRGAALTLGAAALLFLAAAWLPARLRRPAIAGAVLLAGLFLGQAATASRALPVEPPPMPELPAG